MLYDRPFKYRLLVDHQSRTFLLRDDSNKQTSIDRFLQRTPCTLTFGSRAGILLKRQPRIYELMDKAPTSETGIAFLLLPLFTLMAMAMRRGGSSGTRTRRDSARESKQRRANNKVGDNGTDRNC